MNVDEKIKFMVVGDERSCKALKKYLRIYIFMESIAT